MKAMINKMSRQEIKPLLDALESPSKSVQITALQLLVRMNLEDEDQLEVSRYVMNLLETEPEGEQFDSQTPDSLPYQEVIEAAAFVSTKEVQTYLNKLLEAEEKNVRIATENALTKIKKPESASNLFEELSNPNSEQYTKAIGFLSLTDILIYLPPKYASHLVTALVQDTVEYALTTDDVLPNDLLVAVAAIQDRFEPDIAGLFKCYVEICKSENVLSEYSLEWSVTWLIAWIVSRAVPEHIHKELSPFIYNEDPFLNNDDERVRDLATQLIMDADICKDIDVIPAFGGSLGDFLSASRDSIKKLFEPNKDTKIELSVTVAYPRKLAKGKSSLILVEMYPTNQAPEREIELKDKLDKPHESETKSDDFNTSAIEFIIKLESTTIDFDQPDGVSKNLSLDGQAIETSFYATPKDNCYVGKNGIKISVLNRATQVEEFYMNLDVQVVDYAFDHISRPKVSLGLSFITAIGSLAVFVLAFFEQLDKSTGSVAGTALLGASGYFIYIWKHLYQKLALKTQHPPPSGP
ncbi:MAG: hypothetical protein KC421_09265 [Anaerolineales bacterium]|nr:hypothetical protein [Anaerolineales bacterium]